MKSLRQDRTFRTKLKPERFVSNGRQKESKCLLQDKERKVMGEALFCLVSIIVLFVYIGIRYEEQCREGNKKAMYVRSYHNQLYEELEIPEDVHIDFYDFGMNYELFYETFPPALKEG
jgi:hypothetical protein